MRILSFLAFCENLEMVEMGWNENAFFIFFKIHEISRNIFFSEIAQLLLLYTYFRENFRENKYFRKNKYFREHLPESHDI